jgi:hypothetical protein
MSWLLLEMMVDIGVCLREEHGADTQQRILVVDMVDISVPTC